MLSNHVGSESIHIGIVPASTEVQRYTHCSCQNLHFFQMSNQSGIGMRRMTVRAGYRLSMMSTGSRIWGFRSANSICLFTKGINEQLVAWVIHLDHVSVI